MAAIQPDLLTTISSVQTILNIQDNRENALLDALIGQVSAAITEKLGRRILLLENPANPLTEFVSGKGDNWLILRHRPIYTPILTGNTVSGSPVVTNLAGGQGPQPTSYLFVGQPVTGPAIPAQPFLAAGTPANVSIASVDSATQVTLSQNCIQTTTTSQLYFGLRVWEQDEGYWGSVPSSFPADSELAWGMDFALRADEPDGSSRSGMLLRINDLWHTQYARPGANMSQMLAAGMGNIKVQASYGWSSVPADLEMAVIRVIAKIRNSRLYGDIMKSESKSSAAGDYSYWTSPFNAVINMGLLGGDVGPIINRYANSGLGE